MKTTLKHLEDLREEHAVKAIANLHAEDTDGETASTEYERLRTALYNAFKWADSPEGYDFWDSIYESLLDDTYFDAPQITPEKLKGAARESMYGLPKRMATEEDYKQLDELTAALPKDAAERKTYPIYSGFMCYFPHAIAAVAHLSYKGNQQHHPDKPLHWDMDKSQDELDAMMRHTIDGVTATTAEQEIDEAKRKAWRAMADLERKLTGKCQYTNK